MSPKRGPPIKTLAHAWTIDAKNKQEVKRYRRLIIPNYLSALISIRPEQRTTLCAFATCTICCWACARCGFIEATTGKMNGEDNYRRVVRVRSVRRHNCGDSSVDLSDKGAGDEAVEEIRDPYMLRRKESADNVYDMFVKVNVHQVVLLLVQKKLCALVWHLLIN